MQRVAYPMWPSGRRLPATRGPTAGAHGALAAGWNPPLGLCMLHIICGPSTGDGRVESRRVVGIYNIAAHRCDVSVGEGVCVGVGWQSHIRLTAAEEYDGDTSIYMRRRWGRGQLLRGSGRVGGGWRTRIFFLRTRRNDDEERVSIYIINIYRDVRCHLS